MSKAGLWRVAGSAWREKSKSICNVLTDFKGFRATRYPPPATIMFFTPRIYKL